jgi:hypothetical protein
LKGFLNHFVQPLPAFFSQFLEQEPLVDPAVMPAIEPDVATWTGLPTVLVGQSLVTEFPGLVGDQGLDVVEMRFAISGVGGGRALADRFDHRGGPMLGHQTLEEGVHVPQRSIAQRSPGGDDFGRQRRQSFLLLFLSGGGGWESATACEGWNGRFALLWRWRDEEVLVDVLKGVLVPGNILPGGRQYSSGVGGNILPGKHLFGRNYCSGVGGTIVPAWIRFVFARLGSVDSGAFLQSHHERLEIEDVGSAGAAFAPEEPFVFQRLEMIPRHP